jgi:hypothetical protein
MIPEIQRRQVKPKTAPAGSSLGMASGFAAGKKNPEI